MVFFSDDENLITNAKNALCNRLNFAASSFLEDCETTRQCQRKNGKNPKKLKTNPLIFCNNVVLARNGARKPLNFNAALVCGVQPCRKNFWSG
jgi:hypothetical protein